MRATLWILVTLGVWLETGFAIDEIGLRKRLAEVAALPEAEREIVLPAGEIVLTKPLVIGPELRGLRLRGAGTETKLVGAVSLNQDQMSKVTGDNRQRLKVEAHDKVRVVDLRKAGFRHLGPWPNRLSQGDRGGIVDLFYNGSRLPLARWPNTGETTLEKVTDVEGGAFIYRDARHAQWPVDRGVWVQGYFRVVWQLDTVKVGSIDSETREVRLAEPLPGGVGSKYHRPDGSGKEPYHVVNLLEELDRPGEWCLDFESGLLYVWPPGPLANEEGRPLLSVADLWQPLIHCKDVEGVAITDLCVERTLGVGIRIEGGSGCRVERCTVRDLDGWAIELADGSDHVIRLSHLHDLGGGGVRVTGGDHAKLEKCGHLVERCHIHHYGEIQRVYSAGVQAGYRSSDCVGATVRGNQIDHAPHAGILFGGALNVFEQNDIHHVCQVSNDMGAFYAWHDWTSYGNEIRYNRVSASPDAHGVYFDDGDCGDRVYGNVFEGVDVGVLIGGGHDHEIENNVMIGCRYALHLDNRGKSRGYREDNPRLKAQLDRIRQEEIWKTTFPALFQRLGKDGSIPRNNLATNNVAFECEHATRRNGSTEDLAHSKLDEPISAQERPTHLPDGRAFPRVGP